MKIKLPFGRVVDTDMPEPPDDPPEIIEAAKKLQGASADPGKDGSLTSVLLGQGAYYTVNELFPKEKVDAAAKIMEKVNLIAEGYTNEIGGVDNYWKGVSILRDLGMKLACLSNALDEAKAHGSTEDQELITQILLPPLRDDIKRELRHIISPELKQLDEECEAEPDTRQCGTCESNGSGKCKPPEDGSACKQWKMFEPATSGD